MTALRPRTLCVPGLLLILMALNACVDPFQGSRIVGNLFVGDLDPDSLVTPPRLPDGSGGFTWAAEGDPGYVDHYELYAGIDGIGNVRILNFLIRPIFEVHHPCYTVLNDDIRITPDGESATINMCRDPYPLLERTLFALVSAAPTDIGDANPGYRYLEWGLPLRTADNTVTAPDCGDIGQISYDPDAVQDFCDNLHEDYYVGNPFQFSKPVNGTLYGLVNGIDPRTNLAMGGFLLNSEYQLKGMTSLYILADPDPGRLTEENFHANLPPNPAARIAFLARTDQRFGYIAEDLYEGVIHGLMEDPDGSSAYLEFTLYVDLDTDNLMF